MCQFGCENNCCKSAKASIVEGVTCSTCRPFRDLALHCMHEIRLHLFPDNCQSIFVDICIHVNTVSPSHNNSDCISSAQAQQIQRGSPIRGAVSVARRILFCCEGKFSGSHLYPSQFPQPRALASCCLQWHPRKQQQQQPRPLPRKQQHQLRSCRPGSSQLLHLRIRLRRLRSHTFPINRSCRQHRRDRWLRASAAALLGTHPRRAQMV